MVGDITAVLDDLGIVQAHFWGYSMGGTVGLAAGIYEAKRFKSLIIGGAGLVEKDDAKAIEKYQEYIRGYQQRIPIYNQGIEAATIHLKETLGENVNDYIIERWMKADPRSLIAYCSNKENIGMERILPTLTLPCLIYAGENDKGTYRLAQKCANIMQNTKFVSLPGLGHDDAFIEKEQILPHITKFLEENK